MLVRLKQLLAEIQPQVLHVQGVNAYAWLAALTGFHPYVVTPWGADVNVGMRRGGLTHYLSGMALRRADLITCDAGFMKGQLMAWGVEDTKIKLVMFGVDFRRILPDSPSRGQVKRDGLGSPVIISTRLLTPERDVETFIRASPMIKGAFPGASFVVVGSGGERARLMALAVSEGVSDSVRFVGHVSEEEMIDWLHASDVYVSSSLMDAGLAASTAEAMACGLPVVTTDNSENALWIHEGVGGYLFSNRDSQELAEHVIKLLKTTGVGAAMGAYNVRLIRDRNNYEVEMQRMENLYERLARSA
jgi:glycosyltransferase involved in cell wall biosynthesis